MGFSSKRGRPRKSAAKVDKGTAQLQAKRRAGATFEVFDLLLAKALISDVQHRAGMHLRWLFTLKNGAPNVSAASYEEFFGRELRSEDASWRVEREGEYDFAMVQLNQSGVRRVVMDAAVYGKLRLPVTAVELGVLRDGLGLLCKLWQKKRH